MNTETQNPFLSARYRVLAVSLDGFAVVETLDGRERVVAEVPTRALAYAIQAGLEALMSEYAADRASLLAHPTAESVYRFIERLPAGYSSQEHIPEDEEAIRLWNERGARQRRAR